MASGEHELGSPGETQTVHIISRKQINEFVSKHSEAKPSLARWYNVVKRLNFSNFTDLQQTFPSADQVGKLTVFNIGGNKIRLIAAIHYNRKKIYIRAVLTHTEYDEQRWKE
jgi:mRNA interferase HigB